MKPVIHVQHGIAYFDCPGCECLHGPRIEGEHAWTWNGDTVRPTFSPSILCRATKRLTDEEIQRVMQGETIEPVPTVCHSFVRDGQIEFLGDCTHELAGKTVPLPEWR